MSSVQPVTHVLGLYRSRASSPGETTAVDDYIKHLLRVCGSDDCQMVFYSFLARSLFALFFFYFGLKASF